MISWGTFEFRQNFGWETPETFRAESKGFPAKEPRFHWASVTITCSKTGWPFFGSFFGWATWKSPKRCSIGLAVVILNDKIEVQLPVNNSHRQTLEMAVPAAKTELRKWNWRFCSNRLQRKKWNTSEGRPFGSRKCPVKTFLPFGFKPVEPETLSK